MTLTEIFTEYKIVKFARSTFKGYDESPAIGLFNEDDEEIAQIFDSSEYYLNGGEYMFDENGDDVQEDDPFESNIKGLYEIHCAMAFSKIKDLQCKLEEWLNNKDVMVTVAYRINGKDVEDPCEYFYKEVLKLLKPQLKEACSESKNINKMQDIIDTYKCYERVKEECTWCYFKEYYDMPKSWTIAKFKKEAELATIKLNGKV